MPWLSHFIWRSKRGEQIWYHSEEIICKKIVAIKVVEPADPVEMFYINLAANYEVVTS